jgi:FkbM family methyltransferase
MININQYNLGNYIVPEDTLNGICIDIGANVGSFFKKYISHFSKIYYYEPITQCYNICHNFAKDYDNIYGYNLAVWSDSNIEVDIISHHNNDSGSSAIDSTILNDEWKNKNIIQKINTISLDDILRDINDDIDYCKSDCENSEYFIFLNRDISKIKYIGMEIHWQMGRDKQEELLSYMLKTHSLISGDINYTNYNREILFKRR